MAAEVCDGGCTGVSNAPERLDVWSEADDVVPTGGLVAVAATSCSQSGSVLALVLVLVAVACAVL